MNNDFKEYSELYHHGIKGMRWGIRRYQNPDGSLTPEGRKRYFNSDGTLTKAGKRELKKRYNVKSSVGKGVAGGAVAGLVGARALSYSKDVKKFQNMKNELYNRHVINLTKDMQMNPMNHMKYKHMPNSGSSLVDDLVRNEWARAEKSGIDLKNFKTKDLLANKAVAGQWNSLKSDASGQILRGTYKPYNDAVKDVSKSLKMSKKLRNGALIVGGAVVAATALSIYKNEKNKKRLKERGKETIEFMTSGKMKANDKDSKVTKKVKDDYNKLSDKAFSKKYGGSKSTYAKRVQKYGDPYMNSPLAKAGKALSKPQINKLERSNKRLQKSIDTLKLNKRGLYEEYVKDSIKELQERINRNNRAIKRYKR